MRRFAQPMAARVAGRSGDCAPVYFAQRKEVGCTKVGFADVDDATVAWDRFR
jgi:hypothetical protein